MSSTVHTIPGRAIALAITALLTLNILPVSAADSVDELVDLNLRAWSGEPELLSEVYSPDAVHTATFYDRTTAYTGPDEIATVTGYGAIEPIGPRIDIPAVDGEWRWASFASLGGGAACLFHAVDGLLVRHDCIVPERSSDSRPKVGPADAVASAAIDELTARMAGTWGTGATVERLAEVYAPEAVHTARYLDRTMTYTGPEEIIKVAGLGGSVGTIGDRVDFEAPEGELAWASVADVGGGSVCIYRAVDGMVTRHDCLLPIR